MSDSRKSRVAKRNNEELRHLEGVGPATAKALAAVGFTTIAQVARAKPREWVAVLPMLNASMQSRLEAVIDHAQAHMRNGARSAPVKAAARRDHGVSPRILRARATVVDAGSVVTEHWTDVMKLPAFRFALLRRIAGHRPTRARIIQKLVTDLG